MSETLQTRYRVTGMDCAACAAKIETAVRRMPGVEDVTVSATAGSMTLRHAPATPTTATRTGTNTVTITIMVTAMRPSAAALRDCMATTTAPRRGLGGGPARVC